MQRTNAEPVAGQHETAGNRVPDGDRPLPVHPLEGSLTPRAIGVNGNLRVAAGPEAVAERDQLFPQFDVVEDLAIEHDPARVACIRERLLAVRKIDDGQADMRQPGAFVAVETALVRTAMGQRAYHAHQRFARWGRHVGA